MDEKMRTEGKRKFDEIEIKLKELAGNVEQGLISRSEADYSQKLLLLGFAAWEAQSYAEHGMYDESIRSLAEARRILDGVALICVETPVEDQRFNRQELYHNASVKYYNAQRIVEQTIGRQI